MLVFMYQDIEEAGCCGCLIFSWQDEWFKRTWNTMDTTDGDQRAYWNDVQTNEQHFGLLEFVSDECQNQPVIDGDSSEWSQDQVVMDTEDIRLSVQSDSTYLYILVEGGDYEDGTDYIYFDINPDTGADVFQDITLSREADFILELKGTDETRLWVETDSESYMSALGGKTLTEETEYIADNTGDYHRIYQVLDRSMTYPATGVTLPVQLWETGLMTYGTTDEDSEEYNSLTDFAYLGETLEIRIPWGLLGFSAPNIKEINTSGGTDTRTVEGISLGYIRGNQDTGTAEYSWENWTSAQYRERLKESYYILKEYLKFNSNF